MTVEVVSADNDRVDVVLTCDNCERRILDAGRAVDGLQGGSFCGHECMWTAEFGGMKKWRREEEDKRRRRRGLDRGEQEVQRRARPSLIDIAKMRAVEELENREHDLNAMFVYHALMAQSYTLFQGAR
eukprot:CAMPEP_0198727578 /NCGR_PEP_ID=MMETSP1475-20131203/4523_1 /TAXON_ID= ORGANISM="Unidentified sp., Strain CCMP1999" /NCGR_SAMPLE_ID=MMETSP1475 /ASSEMBLY_ACC=CAM_ASM_001111 /LENGTH=127 /DNA_ID=CAMNT_0044489633 /DNA_START=62 /DNA_END=445 /DNA_ORIENTATION=-